MTKAARDRIKFPAGDGFPFPPRSWSRPSRDRRFRTQPLVEHILDDLGNLIDAIEGADKRDYSHIEWGQLSGLRSVTSQAPNPAAIADFVVDKANSISGAYSGAVKRRFREIPTARIDLTASRELVELHRVVSGMFRKASAKQVLEQSLQNTKSLQDLIDLIEQQSSKMVSSYDAIHPYQPRNLTSLTDLAPTTTQALRASTPVSLAPGTTLPSRSRLDIVTPSSQGASWWKRLWRRLSSS